MARTRLARPSAEDQCSEPDDSVAASAAKGGVGGGGIAVVRPDIVLFRLRV